MANPNATKLTPKQKAELKRAQQETIARAKLAAVNQQRAATRALEYSQGLAGNVQDIGQAAVAGGKFIDTSAAAGYQSPVTGQMTKYLMGSVKDPFAAMRQGAVQQRKLVTSPLYKKRLKKAMFKDYAGGLPSSSGSDYRYGSVTGTGIDMATASAPTPPII